MELCVERDSSEGLSPALEEERKAPAWEKGEPSLEEQVAALTALVLKMAATMYG